MEDLKLIIIARGRPRAAPIPRTSISASEQFDDYLMTISGMSKREHLVFERLRRIRPLPPL
jgi:hypothetical protein